GQVPYIKQKFQIRGTSILVSKTQDLHAHWRALSVRTKPFDQMTPERMNRVFRGVDYLVSKRANALHRGPFIANSLRQALALICRMRTASLAEPVTQYLVRGFQKQNKNLQPAISQHSQLLFEVAEKGAFADVDHEGRALDALFVVAGRHQPGKGRQHRYRKIVDAEIAKVLKRIRR